MKRAVIESPYGAKTDEELERNIAYARYAMSWALQRGYAPYASHLLYTQPMVLDDDKLDERTFGIDAGLAFAECCDVSLVFVDLGTSRGMWSGVNAAIEVGRSVKFVAMWMGLDEDVPLLPSTADELHSIMRAAGYERPTTRRGWS